MIQRSFIFAIAMVLGIQGFSQNKLLEKSSDGKSLKLSSAGASFFANMPLHCINVEYPNKTGHTYESASEVNLSPKDLHPSFYGCLDWHSSVHGHWMLVKLLKDFNNLPEEASMRTALEKSFSVENINIEAAYFDKYKLAKNFERTYGWAWLLKLDEELYTWDDPQAKQWYKNLQPLTDVIKKRWKEYLPKQTYPNRTGVHPNTAFGLVFALDWARTLKDTEFEALIVQRSKDYYLKNVNTPANLEPDGTDFLSPSLEIADLMRRVLPDAEFLLWFNKFINNEGFANVMKLPVVSDRTDYQIVHLDGLALSRAWCMRGIASKLPKKDKRRELLLKQSDEFINKTLPNVANGNYGGDHWLGSFAVYALSLN